MGDGWVGVERLGSSDLSHARPRPDPDADRRPGRRARLRLRDAPPRALADRRLPAGRDRRRAEHAGLRRQPAAGRPARRGRRHPADVRRRPAVPPRGAARRAPGRRARGARAEPGRDRCSGPWSALAVGWGWSAGIVFGLAISVASTVVLIRVLADNGDLHTPTGHIAVGWLVVEDLFTVLVLVLLPAALRPRAAPGRAASPLALGLAVVKVAALVGLDVPSSADGSSPGCSTASPPPARASCSR